MIFKQKICAILVCGYCTAGASDSGIVFAAYPIAVRVRNFFGSGSVGGGGSENSSVRTTVVCGAGLLYEKRYRKMQNAITDNQFFGSHFSVHFFQKQTEKWLSENRSSVLHMANLFGRTTYIERGESLRTSPRNLYKRGAIPSLGGK